MRFSSSLVVAFLVSAFCVVFTARSQVLTSRPHVGVEQVPYDDQVYAYLRHLSIRSLIDGYSETQLPLSVYEVVQFLQQADPAKLSNAENTLRSKFLQTYAQEPREAVTMFSARDAEPLFFDGIFTDKDKYLYRWSDDSTSSNLFVHGIGSLEARHETDPRKASVFLANVGGRFSGTLSGQVGYFMQTTNGHAGGDSILGLEDPLLSANHNYAFFSHAFFDFTTAELVYNNDWFTGKIAREAIGIGGGYQNDNILLSPQSSNYDFLSIGAHVGAVRYQAIYASLVADSISAAPDLQLKYMALHDLTFFLGRDVELGFTDIMVFGRRLDIGYLNPFSFLDVVKHGYNGDADNAFLGTHVRWRVLPGFELRGQAVIDDINAGLIGTGWWSNKFAWQFGGMWAGAFGIQDLDWSAEWMRIEPYVYTHWNSDDDRFSTSGTLLGAQIGPNAMSYWTGLRWAPSAKWTVSLNAELVERGENVYDSTGNLLYNAGADYNLSMTKEGNQSNTHILDGRRVDIFTLTANVEFEPWRGLVVFARGTKKSVNYLEQAPQTPGVTVTGFSTAPRELPLTLIAVGARAFF